jgi:hypothetical protein
MPRPGAPLIAERRALRKALAAAPKRSAERRVIRQQLADLRVKWRKVATTIRFTEPKSARSTQRAENGRTDAGDDERSHISAAGAHPVDTVRTKLKADSRQLEAGSGLHGSRV